LAGSSAIGLIQRLTVFDLLQGKAPGFHEAEVCAWGYIPRRGGRHSIECKLDGMESNNVEPLEIDLRRCRLYGNRNCGVSFVAGPRPADVLLLAGCFCLCVGIEFRFHCANGNSLAPTLQSKRSVSSTPGGGRAAAGRDVRYRENA
jgi:hypothetical protein